MVLPVTLSSNAATLPNPSPSFTIDHGASDLIDPAAPSDDSVNHNATNTGEVTDDGESQAEDESEVSDSQDGEVSDEDEEASSDHGSDRSCSSQGVNDDDEDEDPNEDESVPVVPFPRPFPCDLIRPICEYLQDDTETLLAVQTSCQAGWDAATCLIYRTIKLDSDNAWRSLFSPWNKPVPEPSHDVPAADLLDTSDSGPPSLIAKGLKQAEPTHSATSELAKPDAQPPVANSPVDSGVHTTKSHPATETTFERSASSNLAPTGNPSENAASPTIAPASSEPYNFTAGSPAPTDLLVPTTDRYSETFPLPLVRSTQTPPTITQHGSPVSATPTSSDDLTPAQLRALKAMAAARKLVIGRAPPVEVDGWMRAANAAAQKSTPEGVYLLRNVHAVLLTHSFVADHVEAEEGLLLAEVAPLCQPTTLCIDFGDIDYGEDSLNFREFDTVNETALDGDIVACIDHWKRLKHLNIHSTTSAYPITTHFSGLHTRMYVKPPTYPYTIKGDDGYAIAVQLVKLIVSYIAQDTRNDSTTHFEMACIDKFVHREISGTNESDVPYMAWLLAGIPWTASDELEEMIREETEAGMLNGARADELRDRLDRFFEGDVLKFRTATGMDKCEGCGRECDMHRRMRELISDNDE